MGGRCEAWSYGGLALAFTDLTRRPTRRSRRVCVQALRSSTHPPSTDRPARDYAACATHPDPKRNPHDQTHTCDPSRHPITLIATLTH